MRITRQTAAQKLIDYLHHRITLKELVDWAEWAMMEPEFEEKDAELLREVIGYLGLADVKAFGLTWEDFENFLLRLGYQIKILINPKVSF
ncbi:MAG: hypothetical protein FVQ79_12960 [Planctomycetes bacterium]|nr:hypothetical protein [Planctomycetota bacterium]